MIRDNITFPADAVRYLKNLFINPLDSEKEVEDLIKQTGSHFFKIAEKIIENNWGDWSKTMKIIGEETGA